MLTLGRTNIEARPIGREVRPVEDYALVAPAW